MQTIGKMEDGRMIVVVTDGEAGILELVRKMIDARFADVVIAATASPTLLPAAKLLKPAKIAARSAPPTKAKAKKQKRLCAWCGKPMPANASPLAKTHKGECNKLYIRKTQRESWRKKHGVKKPRLNLEEPAPCFAQGATQGTARALSVNPADPLLTDAEREAAKAARLKVIAASAQKHADD